MDGKIVARIAAGLVLIAAVAGIAFFAFNAGVAQGSPVTIQAPSDGTTPIPYPYYGFGYPFHHPFGFGWGFGILGLLLPLFLLFVAVRAVRFLLWGPRHGWRHGMHMHGPWGMGSTDGAPPVFNEWHKRAHSQMTEGKQE